MRFLINRDCTYEEAIGILDEKYSTIAIDIEFVSLKNQLPLGIGVAVSPDLGFYFFDTHDEYLHKFFNQASKVIMHNCASDIPILKKLGYEVRDFEDTMLMCYSAGILNKALSEAAPLILGKPNPKITSLWTHKDQAKKGNVGINHKDIGKLCIIHACNTYGLYQCVPITPLYKKIDKPSALLVMEMEANGIAIDQYRVTQVEQAAIERSSKLEAEIKAVLGDININSDVQLRDALIAKGIIGTRKTKKSGKMATSRESLEPLHDPTADKILDYRSEMKTISTYIKAFRKVDDRGRVHTVYGNASSGRWTSGDKEQDKLNLQNITRDSRFVHEDEDE